MSDARWERLLELVRRDLGADDARIEIGGRPPKNDSVVWAPVGPSRRLVACFATPPADPTAKHRRLCELAQAFRDVALTPVPPPRAQLAAVPGSSPEWGSSHAALDEELSGIAFRTGARAALVLDASSPMLWGCSLAPLRPLREVAVSELLGLADAVAARAGLPRAEDPTASYEALAEQLAPSSARMARLLRESDSEMCESLALCARAVAVARSVPPESFGAMRLALHDGDLGLLGRSVSGVYAVLVVFAGGFGEPRADGVVRRARRHLARLIAALPPVEPPPEARALRLVPPSSS